MKHQEFNRRHSPNRRSTNVAARLFVEDITLDVVVENVSFEGMRVTAPHLLEPGTALTVEVLGERIPAIVHWSKDQQTGLHLLQRLGRHALLALETADDELAEFR